jgi:hypothetical protein
MEYETRKYKDSTIIETTIENDHNVMASMFGGHAVLPSGRERFKDNKIWLKGHKKWKKK